MLLPAHSAVHPGGPVASSILDAMKLHWGVLVPVYLATMTALALAVAWKASRATEEDATKPGETGESPKDATRRLSIGVALAVTTVLLGLLLVSSVRAGRELSDLSSGPAIAIDVTGHQWWWEVTYRDPTDLARMAPTVNEIHVPVGSKVRMTLRSADVIHSFWAPSLAGKRDLIPSHEITHVFQADREGDYLTECAEFCGQQHAHMQLHVIAEPAAQANAWIDAQAASASEPTTPSQSRGRDVFLNANCVTCHAVRGTAAGSHVGPDLTHVASRATIAAGTLPMSRASLEAWILDPQRIKPGTPMPPVQLPPDDLAALLDWLESLR